MSPEHRRKSRLSIDEVGAIKQALKNGEPHDQLAAEYNVTLATLLRSLHRVGKPDKKQPLAEAAPSPDLTIDSPTALPTFPLALSTAPLPATPPLTPEQLISQPVRQRRGKISPDQAQQILELYETTDLKVAEIAERFNISQSSVSRIVGQQQQQQEYRAKRSRLGERKTLPINEVIELYQQGLGLEKLGELYGVSHVTIRRRLRQAGVNTAPGGATTKLDEQVIALYQQDKMDIKDIAHQYEVSSNTVRLYLLANGVELRNRLRRQLPLPEIIALYQAGVTLQELGRQFGVHRNTIKAHLLAQGITIKSTEESS